MMRRVVRDALLLSALCLPLRADPAAPVVSAPAAPRARLSVVFALVSDADIQAARATLRLVSADSVLVSRRTWGEARVNHFTLQVVAGPDAARLLAALTGAKRLTRAILTVPVGGGDILVRPEQITLAKPLAGRPPDPVLPVPPDVRFVLRPAVRQGVVSLGYAPFSLPLAVSGASAEEPQPLGLAEVANARSGETIVLLGLTGRAAAGGPQLAVFVTPTVF